MRRKRHKPEEIVAKLRLVDVLVSQGKSVTEVKVVIESWRRHYNTVRPHGSLGYKPPAPEVFVPARDYLKFCARGGLNLMRF